MISAARKENSSTLNRNVKAWIGGWDDESALDVESEISGSIPGLANTFSLHPHWFQIAAFKNRPTHRDTFMGHTMHQSGNKPLA